MGRCAAKIGDERGNMLLLVQNRIGRAYIARHQDSVAAIFRFRQQPRMPEQHLENAFNHLHDIGTPFAQIGILDRLELFNQGIGLLLERPFRVTALLANEIARRFG